MSWKRTFASWKPSTSWRRSWRRRSENYLTEDADILLVGFGIVSRVLRSTVDQLRAQGVKAGLFRPITLWPFPSRELRETAKHVKSVMVVELSTGMMVEDVKLTLNGTRAGRVLRTRRRQRAHGGRNYRAGVRAHGGPGVNGVDCTPEGVLHLDGRNCGRLRNCP